MFEVIPFEAAMEAAWDTFVLKESVNGTFLQTRNFLNYHPPRRFQDCSILIKDDKKRLCAVVPACKITEGGKQIFFSHKGSTFGGLVVGRKHYRTRDMEEILLALDTYFYEYGFDKVILKITSPLFSREDSALLEYMLSYHNYGQYTELSTYINYRNYNKDILKNFNATKRLKVHRLQQANFICKQLEKYEEIAEFYMLLSNTLSQKYQTKPVHTLRELIDLKENRLKGHIRFFGVFASEKMLAGGMFFEFPEVLAAHGQYFAMDLSRKHEASTYLYYSAIKFYQQMDYRFLSWGISTEAQGRKLNFNLIKNKESYGSKYSLNRTFYKTFTK